MVCPLPVANGAKPTVTVHPDPGSGRLYDETSFKKEHEGWGPERDDRPSICFQWEKDENQTHHTHPGYMMHNGLIVLGPHDKPITNWPEIPATLSSGTPGYKLEAMRRQNMDIKQGDCKSMVCCSSSSVVANSMT